MKKRNHAFDFLCGICIIRMMLLHVTDNCGFGDESWWRTIMYWSYFFMSFFFFKAGYFNKTVSGDSRAYCLDKFKRLMIPYFVWGFIGDAIYFFFALCILPPENKMVQLITPNHIWTTSKFYGNVPCWFLLSFFCAYICMHFISKVRGLRWIVIIFPLISWWLARHDNPLWFSLNNVFFGIFLFFLGRVWKWVMQRLRRRGTICLSVLLTAGFVWLNAARHGEYTMSDNLWAGQPLDIIAGMVCALCGISGILLSLPMPRVPVINFIGQHSMVFFVAHMPMIVFYRMLRSAFVHTLRGHWDDWILLVVITFSVCFLLVPHVEKVPWLSGRFPKKNVES